MRIASRLGSITRPVAVATLGLAATGCISQEKYNAIRLERDGLVEQMARASQDTAVAQQKAATYKLQLDQLAAGGGSRDALVANLTQQNNSLSAQLGDITAKYNDAISRIGAGSPLPIELSNELTRFADQNPDLVDFDAKRGTVKFKSDLTFASGDAQLQPGARDAITKFAAILNSPAARGYELLVCGHADTQPVSAGTQARGHKDNWHLSSHRALSVAEALQKQGVEPKRIGAVGYGQFRPVASNDSKAGMAMNRRVEVLILPQQLADSIPQAPTVAAPEASRPRIEVNNEPALNK